MRTDAKIGFAIGGVLLAVLAAYLLVVGPKHNTKKTVALVPTPAVTPAVTSETPAVTPTSTLVSAPTPPMASANDGGGAAFPTPTPANPLPSSDDHAKPAFTDARGPIVDGNSKLFHRSEPTKPADSGDNMTDGIVTQNASTAGDVMQPPVSAIDHVKTTGHRITNRRGNDHTVTAEHTVAGANAPRQYTVKSGQTLSSIAEDVYGNARFWVAIQRENAGLDAKHLKVGEKINMPDISDIRPTGPVLVDVVEPVATTGGTEVEPTAHTYRVQSGDSLYKISKKVFGTGRRASAIYDLNKELIGDDDAKLKLGMLLKLPEAPNRTVVSSVVP